MPYLLSIVGATDPEQFPAVLSQDKIAETLRATAAVTSSKRGRWRFDDGVVGIDLSVDESDPTRELTLKVGWSTSDQLLRILEFATDLAGKLGAHVYDRNGQSFVSRARVDAMRSSGGASPATRVG